VSPGRKDVPVGFSVDTPSDLTFVEKTFENCPCDLYPRGTKAVAEITRADAAKAERQTFIVVVYILVKRSGRNQNCGQNDVFSKKSLWEHIGRVVGKSMNTSSERREVYKVRVEVIEKSAALLRNYVFFFNTRTYTHTPW
jgi:hypothetical protein